MVTVVVQGKQVRVYLSSVCSLLLLVLTTLWSTAAVAATLTVTKTADTNDGTCDADCSLREAVVSTNASAGHDLIILPAGTYVLTLGVSGEDAAAEGDLDITDDLTLSGSDPNPIIDGNANDRVIEVFPGSTVELEDVMLRNGQSPLGEDGGGIRNLGTLSVRRTVIANNTADRDGGGICSFAATLLISASTVTGNSAGRDAGGVYSLSDSGAFDNTVILGSTISNNTAVDFGGGVSSVSSTVTISNTIIENNSAAIAGGVDMDVGASPNPKAHLQISDSTIRNNTSSSMAGGVSLVAAKLTLSRTLVEGNTSATAGGISLVIGTSVLQPLSSISGSTISGNVATGGTAGGILVQDQRIGITNSTISGNTASASGAGLHISNSAKTSELALSYVTITGNVSSSSTGGLAAPSGSVTVDNSIAAMNTGTPADCTDGGSTISSGGHNLIGDGSSCPGFLGPGDQVGTAVSPIDPLVGPLAANGGITTTHALLAGSPAMEAADPNHCLSTDQRNVLRPEGSACDIGAYEFQGTGGACGNGSQDPNEACDDGNRDDGDGCSGDCVVEVCGDGTLQPALGEECEDGGTSNGDGCSSSCQIEPVVPIPMDHFKCWQASDLKNPKFFKIEDVPLDDQFVTENVTVRKPFLFCSPADKDGSGINDPNTNQCCYKISGSKLQPAANVEITDQFGKLRLALKKGRFLCQPCSKTVLP